MVFCCYDRAIIKMVGRKSVDKHFGLQREVGGCETLAKVWANYTLFKFCVSPRTDIIRVLGKRP